MTLRSVSLDALWERQAWYQMTSRLITVTSRANQKAAVTSVHCCPHINLLFVINTGLKSSVCVCVCPSEERSTFTARSVCSCASLHYADPCVWQLYLNLSRSFSGAYKTNKPCFLLLVQMQLIVCANDTVNCAVCHCGRVLSFMPRGYPCVLKM